MKKIKEQTFLDKIKLNADRPLEDLSDDELDKLYNIWSRRRPHTNLRLMAIYEEKRFRKESSWADKQQFMPPDIDMI